jgi:hypothetical protein
MGILQTAVKGSPAPLVRSNWVQGQLGKMPGVTRA